MKRFINIAVVSIVVFLTGITITILYANFSNSIGFSLSYDTQDVVIPMIILVCSGILNLINKSWKMLGVSVVGLVEMLILGLILLN